MDDEILQVAPSASLLPRRHRKRRTRDIDQPIIDLATHPTETVTPKVLASYPAIGCDARTIIKMVEAGALVGYRVGREWRIATASARAAFCKPATATSAA